jgi:hypothetical protein
MTGAAASVGRLPCGRHRMVSWQFFDIVSLLDE